MSLLGLIGVHALMALVGVGLIPMLGLTRTRSELLVRLGVAYLLGVAVTGVVAATLATIRVPISPIVPAVLAVLSLAAGRRRASTAWRNVAPRTRIAVLDRAAQWILAPGLLVATGVTLFVMRLKPISSEYDAWAIWGLKAHALAALGSANPIVFASRAYAQANLDYPILLPSVDALGIDGGGYQSRFMIFQTVLFGVAGMLALWGLLADRVRPLILWPALTAIAAAPSVLGQLGTAYSDMSLAFLVAAGLVAAARWIVDRRSGWLVLGTVFFAAAVLTKNEGLLFMVAAYVSLLIVASGRRRPLLVSAAAVACALAPWRIFMAVHHLHQSFYKLSDSFRVDWVSDRWHRGPTALNALVTSATTRGSFELLPWLCLLAGAIAFAAGARRLLVLGAVFTLLSFAGLTWIFVISPIDLHDYLAQTQDRIIASIVIGVAALAPLVVGEAVRKE